MRTLKELTEFVEKEAAREGPAAQAALQAERDRFRIARELAEVRAAQGLTQQQLSERSGVPQSEISKLESGKANATELTLFKVAHAMGYAFRLEPRRAASKRAARVSPARRSPRGG